MDMDIRPMNASLELVMDFWVNPQGNEPLVSTPIQEILGRSLEEMMMTGQLDPMLASTSSFPTMGEMADLRTEREWTPTVSGEGEEQRQEPVPSPDNPFRQEPPLDPEFLPCRYVVQTDEQAYIKKDEVVQLTTWANTRVALCIVHSSPKYRSHTIVGTRLLSEEDTNNSSFPLRAWAAGESPLYREIELPNIGEAKCAVVQVGGDGHINLQFTELSTSKKNHGNTKEGKLSELLVFRVPESLTVDSLETAATLPMQVVAELRDPTKLKKPKRSDVALATKRPIDDVEEGGRLFQKYWKRLTSEERRLENNRMRAKIGSIESIDPQ